MSTIIPPEFNQFVQDEIASGRFDSEEAMVREGLRLLRRRQEALQEFRENLNERFKSLDRGEGIEIEGDEALGAFFDEIENEVRQELAARNPTHETLPRHAAGPE